MGLDFVQGTGNLVRPFVQTDSRISLAFPLNVLGARTIFSGSPFYFVDGFDWSVDLNTVYTPTAEVIIVVQDSVAGVLDRMLLAFPAATPASPSIITVSGSRLLRYRSTNSGSSLQFSVSGAAANAGSFYIGVNLALIS